MLKKRGIIGVFCFYNSSGYIGRYVFDLLDKMLSVLDSLIIVSNSEIADSSFYELQRYSSKIVERKNIGYDAGAYKEILSSDENLLNEYQELILFNDTFYLIDSDIEKIFNTMHEKELDFWGITQNDDPRIRSHVQSYFLAFSKKILESPDFKKFWKELSIDQTNINFIISDFEIGLTRYFEDRGFSWGSLCGRTDLDIYNDSYEMLCKYNCPILKRKALFSSFQSKLYVRKIFDYIQSQTNYSVENIYEDIRINKGIEDLNELGEDSSEKLVCEISLDKIKSMVQNYSTVLIYGLTVCGLELSKEIKGKYVEFVVSDEYYSQKKVNGIKVIPYSKAVEDADSIMIVTLGYDNCQKLKKTIDWKKIIYYW